MITKYLLYYSFYNNESFFFHNLAGKNISEKLAEIGVTTSETKVQQIDQEAQSRIKEQINDLVEFEKTIAKITKTSAERRQDSKTYRNSSLGQLDDKANFLNWTQYFNDAFVYHLGKPLEHEYTDVTYAGEYIGKYIFQG